ncbi:MAG: hypothetical protein Q4Q18_00105 [Methanobrevibacter sp.]|nr:hypothetical protein [Methanobrevibacter sp.]
MDEFPLDDDEEELPLEVPVLLAVEFVLEALESVLASEVPSSITCQKCIRFFASMQVLI